MVIAITARRDIKSRSVKHHSFIHSINQSLRFFVHNLPKLMQAAGLMN